MATGKKRWQPAVQSRWSAILHDAAAARVERSTLPFALGLLRTCLAKIWSAMAVGARRGLQLRDR
jgi:hypothetical protein